MHTDHVPMFTFYYVVPGKGAKYYDEYVCLSAHITRKPHDLHQIFTHISCPLAVAMARSFSGGVAIMLRTSGFVDYVIFSHNGPMARNV